MCVDVSFVLVLFQFVQLTRGSAVTHMCDCGVIRRPMVLGEQLWRSGARAVGGLGELGIDFWWVSLLCKFHAL